MFIAHLLQGVDILFPERRYASNFSVLGKDFTIRISVFEKVAYFILQDQSSLMYSDASTLENNKLC